MTRQERRRRDVTFDDARWSRRHAGELKRAARLLAAKRAVVALFAVALLLTGYRVMAADKTPAEVRADANKAQRAGNWKDAYEAYAKLTADPAADKNLVAADLLNGVQCLNQLGRTDEADEFIEKVVAVHKDNWRLLEGAAQQYQNLDHNGFIVAGKYYRGGRRGDDGKWVSAMERDRVRSLQLMQQATEKVAAEGDKDQRASFYIRFADVLLDRRFGGGGWRMQYLSDLTKLPDYDESQPNYYYRRGRGYGGGSDRGAPVDADGKPVFHAIPKSWQEAKTDGERWRWCLMMATETSADHASQAKYMLALFLRDQFDVHTMLAGGFRRAPAPRPAGGVAGIPGRDGDDDTRKDETGPYAVQGLGEDETIARLANGIKRFKLPDEFNFIKLARELAGDPKLAYAQHGAQLLATSFEDRRQLPKAAEFWKLCVDQNWSRQHAQQRLDQIVGKWGEFNAEATNPAGAEPTLNYLFRNGSKVSFTAQSLDVEKLLTDVKAYLKTKPNRPDYRRMQIENIGYRIVQENQNQYVVKEVAKWDVDLKPRDGHLDKWAYVKAPLKEAGAYLVTAKMDGGNTTRVIVWVADTAVVKKAIDGGSYLYVADANSGAGIAKANVSLFGFRQRYEDNGRTMRVDTQEFAEFTDADGQLILKNDRVPNDHQWLIQVQAGDRRAYLGFSNLWGGDRGYDAEYHAVKAFTVTDRPVYRPGQAVKFKTWVGQAKYDQEGKSPFAGTTFTVRISDPRGEKLSEKAIQADQFGGLAGELELGKEASLGVYNIEVVNANINEYGGNTFRVEEYKKPEFEVKIDAPTEPVMLGEKINATVKANYYFGAPVTNAKVKVKVMRTSFRANWFPPGVWDWFYEPGYWWFGQAYRWYPGFGEWGCLPPTPPWANRSFEQPELVSENEVEVGADGTVKVEIDTAIAKAVHGDTDHKYEVTAEVTDESRRTIVGTGTVSVARKPFKVYAWVDRGFFNENDVVHAHFSARTVDDKPVKGKGELKLLKVAYDAKQQPVETAVGTWPLDTNDEGAATQQLKAAQPGQYRLSYTVTDAQGRAIEGGYVFVVRGPGFDGKEYRFNELELQADKKEYAAGDTLKLQVNTNKVGGTVLLFEKAANGVYLPPKVLKLAGKSTVHDVAVSKREMPNFFVEAVTVGDGRVFTETKEIVVPPESRVTNVAVKPSQDRYKPGEKATFTFRLTDAQGKPVEGSAVVSVYDKSVEYVSGGSNTPDVRKFFWQWRRHHYPRTESSLTRASGPVHKNGEKTLQYVGRFGFMSADLPAEGDEVVAEREDVAGEGGGDRSLRLAADAAPMAAAAPAGPMARPAAARGGVEFQKAAGFKAEADAKQQGQGPDPAGAGGPAIAVRTKFADTALWAAAVNTNANGEATVELPMPENLTTWKTKVYTLSAGTRVGQGESEVTTYKDLIVRLQAPRFFVEKDEVVLSANVHNYTKQTQEIKVNLDLPGDVLSLLNPNPTSDPVPGPRVITLAAGGEQRVDWRVKVNKPGEAKVRVSAIAGTESDATEQTFPAYVHGMLKTESFSGALRPGDKSASIAFKVPKERIPEQTRVEVRYSPSVAVAMVDALPYLVDYPYGCTEQTLNRFLPTVVTQRVLLNMGLDLKDIQAKRTNLNAQEIGDDAKRAADWKRNNPPPGQKERNPVFDVDTVNAMTRDGVNRLTNMQNADGGWGWFYGAQEASYPHTTALVVHGLQIARANDVALVPGVLENGVEWLKRYQSGQVDLLNRAKAKVNPWKDQADDLDAFVYMVLTDAGIKGADAKADEMREFLYRDRNFLAVYTKAMFGLALTSQQPAQKEKLDMVLQNIGQFLVKDGENQTAYLKMPEGNRWWYWHGSDIEANAYYLKLLSKTDPKGETPALLAKYIINNRKHASYWNSTRDTATAIEALADFIKASGEDKPDMTVKVLVDGKEAKSVKISAANLFSYDNKVVLEGPAVTDGAHTVEVVREGNGPLYFNAYVTNFTLEDRIAKTGLEVKVDRKFYKLVPKQKTIKVAGQRGQALDQKVEAYERQAIADLSTLTSGDLVEVELEIDSKNDYEYLIFEDMKAAGFEPVEVRSGYNGNDLNAYVEFRDERVAFFARTLARGKHSVSYRLRAEIPGRFSALPTKASAMYAPELKANSDEFKVVVVDAPKKEK